MAGSSTPRVRKRVDVETNSLKRARDGSAFARCEDCHKNVPVVLIDMHSCSFEAKIKMKLDAQVIEKATEVKKKPVERKKTKSTDDDENKSKKVQKEKDPNMPKRPLSAFFVFLEGFRKSFKEANPDNKKVSTVVKEGGEKWKSMTEEEKKPYVVKAAELKAEFDKAMETYNAEKKLEDNEESLEKENVEPSEKANEETSEEKANVEPSDEKANEASKEKANEEPSEEKAEHAQEVSDDE